jgi:hypothetical protein
VDQQTEQRRRDPGIFSRLSIGMRCNAEELNQVGGK